MKSTQAGFESACVSGMPARAAALMLEGHRARIGTRGDARSSELFHANQWLGEQSRALRAAHVTRAFDEQRIRDFAENYARQCARMRSLAAREAFARHIGIEPPSGRGMTDEGTTRRLDDPLWWRRALRKRWTRAAENSFRRIGLVCKGRDPYASEYAVRHRAARKRGMRDFLDRHVAVSEQGEQLPLLELAERSAANPSIRRAEFMTRCRGFEEVARDLGHVGEFVTLTTPGTFHASRAEGGLNPSYRQQLVKDAQGWLCRMWARARAKLRRLCVCVYGFRIAEPHHDGTPHWHLLLFTARHHRETLRAVLRGIWLSEFSDERGASEVRCAFTAVDVARGSATGYVAKYVAKNVDGAGRIGDAEDFEASGSIAANVARVDAWASVHGIRQFQQIGGPPVGLWREARRLRKPQEDQDIERARAAADRGDWRAFCYAVAPDHIHAGRKTSLKLERAETGERNKYGECRAARVIGLRYASACVITRLHKWRIEKKSSFSPSPSSLGPVAITVRPAGSPATWANPLETSTAGPLYE